MQTSIWVNLKVISCLEPFQRLNTRGPLFRIRHYRYIPEFLQRWFEGSSRASDFGRILDVYNAALANVEPDCGPTGPPGPMRVHLKNSVRGLESLKKTYEDDTTMLARLDTLLDRVHSI